VDQNDRPLAAAGELVAQPDAIHLDEVHAAILSKFEALCHRIDGVRLGDSRIVTPLKQASAGH
jgi:hypothetical protein